MILNAKTNLATWVRAGWLLLLAGVLGAFAAGAPASLQIARTLAPATLAALDAQGIPHGLPAACLLVLDTLALGFFAAVATLLIWRKPTERMARIAALMLLLTGALYTAPIYEAPLPIWVKALISAGAEMAQVIFIFTFPTGRFVPRWMVWTLLPLALWRFVIWNWVYLPNLFALQRTGETYPFLPQHPVDLLLFLAVVLAGVGVQIYRYRRLASAIEQQQVKWLVWGTTGAVVVVGAYVLLINLLGSSIPSESELLLRLAGRTVRQAALALVPISLVYSILRFRLWDVDALLSRTLGYGLVTGTLAAIFGAVIVTLQVAFAPRSLSADRAVVAASTLLTVLVARPLYNRIQGAVNRRFYRRSWQGQHAVTALRAQLRDPLAADQLAGQVLAVVQEVWQPGRATLWILPAPDDPNADPGAAGSAYTAVNS